MSELVLDSEVLNRSLEGKTLSGDEIAGVFASALSDPRELFEAAQAVRHSSHGSVVTFSKKVFVNLTSLCRDTCTYCTYKAGPDKASMMSKGEVAHLLHLAAKQHCVEALLVTGERPEERYGEARRWLADNGFSSTAEYLVHCSEAALAEGLFPHTNAGNLTYDEMRELQKTNMSMGMMLESSAVRLAQEGMPHGMAPSKAPAVRLGALEDAGRLGIPMTTGLLLGIGETPGEVVDSLLAIRNLHDRFGHIQEIILQNFQPKPDTPMRAVPPTDGAYFRIIVALARIAIPQANIQIPPNLSPDSYRDFLSVGINDWGGISPVTPDFVNPEFPWPSIGAVEAASKMAGFALKCRFPAYPGFLPRRGRLWEMANTVSDSDGLVAEERWR